MISLTIVSPKGTYLCQDVLSFTLPTEKGPLMIGGDYTNVVVNCRDAGVLKIAFSETKVKYYALFHGNLSLLGHKAILSCELIEDGYSIDMARAIAGRDRAKDRLENKDPNIEVQRAKASLARALVRIQVKTLDEGGE